MEPVRFHIANRGETERLGALLSELVIPGDVIGLTGDLGAGKTFFAGAVAHGVGVPEETPVSSPTFTLIKEYKGRIPVYHMDLYRLVDPGELYELGLWEYYDAEGVCLVEWSNLFEDLWPHRALVMVIELGEGEERTFTASGRERGAALADALKKAWDKG